MGWISAAFGIGKGLYQAYKVWFVIVPLAALLAGGWLYVKNARQNADRRAVAEYKLGQSLHSLKTNELALSDCRLINQSNQIQADLMAEQVRKAEIKLAAATATANADVENINREESELRSTGGTCPAIDSNFRKWLRNSP